MGLRKCHYYNRKSKLHAGDPIAIGAVVSVYDPGQPRTLWRMGRVEKLISRNGPYIGGHLAFLIQFEF